MRVTSLLNKLLHLPGLWVRGMEFVGDTLVDSAEILAVI